MGTIQEILSLKDSFSATFAKFLNLTQKSSAVINNLTDAALDASSQSGAMALAYHTQATQVRNLANEQRGLTAAAKGQEQINRTMIAAQQASADAALESVGAERQLRQAVQTTGQALQAEAAASLQSVAADQRKAQAALSAASAQRAGAAAVMDTLGAEQQQQQAAEATTVSLRDQIAALTQAVLTAANAQQASAEAAETVVSALRDEALAAAQNAAAASKNAAAEAQQANQSKLAAVRARILAASQKILSQAQKDTSSATDQLTKKLKSLLKTYLGFRAIKGLFSMADEMSQTTARLDRMNDGLQTTADLNKMIYQSAQRARGSYQETADMVGKFGTLAGDAFNSTAETVAFAEQLNKHFALSGTSAQGASAAMLQLTQAMASGTLRGEELNSVLEQAPTIAQTIADYMGVNIGEMRTLASEGKVTANVVKSALLSAAEDTNAAFESMPKTWSQVWTEMKNNAIMAFQPVLNKINQLANSPGIQRFQQMITDAMPKIAAAVVDAMEKMGAIADFVARNWDKIAPIVEGVAAAVAVYAAAVGAAKVAQALLNSALLSSPLFQVAAAIGVAVAVISAFREELTPLAPLIMGVSAAVLILNAALWANPILMVIGLIGLLVGALVTLMGRFTSLQVLWLTVCNALQYAWNTVVLWIMTGVYAVMNFLDEMSLAFLNVSTNVANFMGNMKVKVLSILQDMVNGAINIINGFIAALNKIDGVNIQAISGVTFAATAGVANAAATMMREAELTGKTVQVEQNKSNRADALSALAFKRGSANATNTMQIAGIVGKKVSTIDALNGYNTKLVNEIGGGGSEASYEPYISDGAGGSGGSGGGGGSGQLGRDVADIKKEVTMSDEELKSLVDMAERKYVNNINLTAQTPVINLTYQGTDNEKRDRKALADTIRDMLIEQQAASSLRSTVYPT